MSNKRIGCENFGKFYTEGKVRNRREWRGVKDTLYDYSRWLHIMTILAKFIVKPRNIKAMFRYRWMANYLAVPMMVDRHTQGLRDEYLRICHLEQDLVIEDVAKLLDSLFRGDRRIGNDKKFSDKVVLVDENEMTAVMMGFPTLKCLSRETPSTYVSVLLNQHAAEHYIDVAQEYGLLPDAGGRGRRVHRRRRARARRLRRAVQYDLRRFSARQRCHLQAPRARGWHPGVPACSAPAPPRG